MSLGVIALHVNKERTFFFSSLNYNTALLSLIFLTLSLFLLNSKAFKKSNAHIHLGTNPDEKKEKDVFTYKSHLYLKWIIIIYIFIQI